MLTNVVDVRWWGLLLVNHALKFVTRVLKQSIEWGGRCVNQLKANPFRDVGKTQYKRASLVVYKLTNTLGSVVSSYLSSASLFLLIGKEASYYTLAKGGHQNDVPKVFTTKKQCIFWRLFLYKLSFIIATIYACGGFLNRHRTGHHKV